MIEKIDDLQAFADYKKTDIYSVRIKSLLSAYGCSYNFAVFYRQINSEKKITAIISKLDNDFTLSFLDNCDTDELAEFFSVMGFASLLCDSSFKIPHKSCGGAVMLTQRKKEFHIPYAVIDTYPRLMDLFNFVDYDAADFESWYVDISHRIRHGCAKAVTLNINDEIISSGIFSSIYENNAILTAVRTKPELRRLGYGSALVSEMICDFNGDVFLMREENKNEEFYIKLGFKNVGKWRMYK